MILRIVTTAELVEDDGKPTQPRNGFKVGAAYSFSDQSRAKSKILMMDEVAARLLSEIAVETMTQVNSRWVEKDALRAAL
jgi:hypothetical protein